MLEGRVWGTLSVFFVDPHLAAVEAATLMADDGRRIVRVGGG